MIGKVSVQTGEFPGTGDVFVFVAIEDKLKNSECFKLLDEKTNGKLSAKMELHEFTGKEGQMISLELDDFYKHIILVGVGKEKEFTLIKWRNALANVFSKVQSIKLTSATVSYFLQLGSDFFEIGKHLSVALHLVNYRYDVFKNDKERKKSTNIQNINIMLSKDYQKLETQLRQGIEYGTILAQGIYLTRDLVNQPASHQHPDSLVEEAKKIEKESKGTIGVKVLNKEECRKLGMGSFLSVAQGSEKPPKFIILHYYGSAAQPLDVINARYRVSRFEEHPSELNGSLKNSEQVSSRSAQEKITYDSPHNSKRICLVGKSIIFDSGGLSLKPSSSMETMKMDMAGGATVLGVFSILSQLKSEKPMPEIYGILPACENMVSGRATRPGDIVTALNGKTIEVLNTDAEGRLTLADGLAYAEKYIKPDVILDLATLTGACMVALGTDITGMFGSNGKLLSTFESIAKKEGEELARLPLHMPYLKLMKSDIADIRNISTTRWGGAITAALFLTEFVKKDHWVHFDIAGTAFNESSPHDIIQKGGTGWGVLTLMEYLQNQK